MEKVNASGEAYRYDAFISYRHLPLDMAVAARLQELLENYRPPKHVEGLRQQRITRIFRDASELPTSGDLGNDISEALKSSRFLIVICSEHIRESRWCMEEINLFKQYHNGRTNHILPLLVSGEPGEVFPPQLLAETRTRTEEDGSESQYEAVIEPLCADVRADTIQQSLKLLKREFLRIAAPILGCSFDDLYQRHLRRKKRQRAFAMASSLGLLSAVLLVVSVFAYQTWRSERAYRETLAENYMMQGSEYAFSDQPQQALLYFSQALSAAPEELPAAYAGAALLLQEYAWPVMTRELAGAILDGGYSACAWALSDIGGEYYLRSTLPAIEVCDGQGTPLRQITVGEDEYVTFLGRFAEQWAFRVESQTDPMYERLLLYDPAADLLRAVERPADASRYYDSGDALAGEYAIAAVEGDRAIVTGAGLVRLIRFDQAGGVQTLCTADLADAFPLMDKAQSISGLNDLWVSEDGALAAVRHLSSLAVYETDGLVLRGTIDTGGYMISDVVFTGRDTLALACGNPYSLGGSHLNPGGCFGVYRADGQVVYQSQPDPENVFLGTAFSPENGDLLLTWSQNMAAVFDLSQERFLTAPLYCPNITSACFYGDGAICVAAASNTLQEGTVRQSRLAEYRFLQLPARDVSPAEGEIGAQEASGGTAVCPDGRSLVCDGQTLSLRGEDGAVLASRELPAMLLGARVVLSEDGGTVYVGDTLLYSGLLAAPVDLAANTIGEFVYGDTGGGTVLNLWPLGAYAAAETSSREIVVFRPDGQRIFSAVPRHSFMPAAVVTDPQGRYLAVCLEETATESGVMGYDQNSYIEVWDIASGLLIADYEVPGKALQTLAITGEGVLVWSAGGSAGSRTIPSDPPDQEARAFLSALCSLALNERQEKVSRTPVQPELSEGGWYDALGGWQSVTFQTEQADESLTDAITRLSGAEDAGSAAWIGACDSVWQALEEERIACTVLEIDLFFETYSVCASNSGRIDEIGYGLQTYFALIDRALEQSEDVVSSSLVSHVLPILCETTAFDQLVAAEFQSIAAGNEAETAERDAAMAAEQDETERFLWEEIDRPLLQLAAYQLRALAASLTGEEPLAAWQEASAFCRSSDVLLYSSGDTYATACLMAGDPSGGAALLNEMLELQTLGLSEEEMLFLSDYFSEHLETVGLLLYRNLIDPADANAYLEALDASFGLEVAGVGAEAQGGGIQLGDAVIAVNGQRIACLAQAKRLLSQGEGTCTVQRGGERLTLPAPKGVAYQFFCTLS